MLPLVSFLLFFFAVSAIPSQAVNDNGSSEPRVLAVVMPQKHNQPKIGRIKIVGRPYRTGGTLYVPPGGPDRSWYRAVPTQNYQATRPYVRIMPQAAAYPPARPGSYPQGVRYAVNPAPAPGYVPHVNRRPAVHVNAAVPQSPAISCMDNIYYVPQNEVAKYRCCGANLYYNPTQYCSYEEASPDLSTIETEGTSKIVCNGVEYYIDNRFRDVYGCCDSQLYEIGKSECVHHSLPPSQPPSSDSGALRCPVGYICCDGFPPIENKGDLLCCPDLGPYDPSLAICSTN